MTSVRQHYPSSVSRSPAELEPGELVWARVVKGLENPSAAGKARPVVLVEARGSAWRTMGLTTRPRYRDGSSRIAIANSRVVGVKRAGWLWSEHLCWLSGIDIESHIGSADDALVEQIAQLANIDRRTVQDLLASARRHHHIPSVPDRNGVEGGAS